MKFEHLGAKIVIFKAFFLQNPEVMNIAFFVTGENKIIAYVTLTRP